MPMGKQSAIIGANQEKDTDLSKTIEMLRSNRTIMVMPLNENAGVDPELNQCQTIKDLFQAYKPEAEVSVRTEDGETEESRLQFKEIKDFSPDSVIRMTPQLQEMKTEIAVLQDLVKQVKQNATLRKALGKPEERKKLLEGLRVALDAIGQPEEA
jgi:predicted component of type VI protein secretion system